MGLEETTREGQSVYLRGWGDRFHHTLQLTEGEQAGLAHIGWRAFGKEELERAVKRLEQAGAGIGWREDSHRPWPRLPVPLAGRPRARDLLGGRALPGARRPGVAFPEPAAAVRPARCRRALHRPRDARRPPAPTATLEWLRDTLGHRYTEFTTIPDQPDNIVFCFTTTCERGHDLGLAWDPTPARGRINHFAYYVETTDNLLRAADVLLNQDVAIEFGPGKHGMGEQGYLYFREPSGLRVELNAGGYRNYEPDWETVRFEPQAGSNVFYRNLGDAAFDARELPPIEMSAGEQADAAQTTGLFV